MHARHLFRYQYVCPQRNRKRRTVFSQQALEVIQVRTALFIGDGDKKSDEKKYHHDGNKRECVLESAPEALPKRLLACLNRHLIVFFVPKIREWYDQQTEQCIKGVQEVIDDGQRIGDFVDGILGGPFFPSAQLGRGSRRDQCDIHGKQKGCSQKTGDGNDARQSYRRRTVPRGLIDIDEYRGHGEQDSYDDSVYDPDQGSLEKRHLGE